MNPPEKPEQHPVRAALKPNVVLIGLMGSGKSTVGRHLADWLGMHLTDTDAQIEYESGLSIPEIFHTQGETAFRQLERRIVQRAAQIVPSVIATGGGVFVDAENQAALKETGLTFYLRASAEHLFERVRHARNRPLLHTRDPLQTLRNLLHQRESAYLTADHVVDVESGNAEQIVQRILAIRKKYRPADPTANAEKGRALRE